VTGCLNAWKGKSPKLIKTKFYLKARMGKDPPLAPVVIIAIDDCTFSDETFKIPQILWHKYFGTVIERLADSGAKVIGLDVLLPGELFDEMVPEYSRTWLKAFGYARSKGVPVVTGFVETPDRQVLPQSRYLRILGTEQIGLFNLTTDQDDFIRRQRLLFPAQQGNTPVYHFSYLLAQVYQKNLTPPTETIYIEYRASQPPFPVCSFAEIYQKARDNDLMFLHRHFEGKIALIGETDTLSSDRHPTPLYHLSKSANVRTPGVEIAAHTVNTLLGNRFFAETPVWLRFSIYLLLALLVSLVTIFGAQRLMVIVFFGLLVGYGGIALVGFMNHRIFPLVPGIAVIVLSQAMSFSYRYAVVDKEKRKIRAIFQKFLPPNVVTQLLATRDADFFKGQHKRVCILFSDIRSFTQYSEKKPPAEVVNRLNEYFAAMSAVVYAEGGIVDKFLGDGIMAFFGALDEHTNPNLSGARAALTMLQELEKLNQQWARQGQEIFQIGIGMHTGEVKIGNIGSPTKMEYTIIGDAVNLASRLQDKTKDLREAIIISEDVYNDIADHVEAEDKGIEAIRGRRRSESMR
jgi:class 3 adenylate cyclase/CHASE2 domain-containing sensor protein